MTIVTVEPDHKVQLPADWVEELALKGLVTLEKTEQGILVRPCPAVSWDEIYSNKLPVGTFSPGEESLEVTGDDLLF